MTTKTSPYLIPNLDKLANRSSRNGKDLELGKRECFGVFLGGLEEMKPRGEPTNHVL
jgi:hypothetical protein